MKIRICTADALMLFFVLLIGLPTVSFAKSLHSCHMCGMDAAKSQTEFVARLDDGSMEHICSLHCVYILEQLNKAHKITSLETRDFTSGSLIDARTALYMKESSLIPKGSMAPFLPAFLSRSDADKYVRKYKGSLVDFGNAMAIVEQFDKDIICAVK